MTAFDQAWDVVKMPTVFHGGPEWNKEPSHPLFFTPNREAAEWYALERGGDKPTLQTAEMSDFKKPASMEDLESAAKELGFGRIYDWGESVSPEYRYETIYDIVGEHSPYDGTNPMDLAYVPQIREALRNQGFDGILDRDGWMNTDIPIHIPLDHSQYEIRESSPVEDWMTDEQKKRWGHT